MEMIILIGLPGSGKSTFYSKKYFHSHIRINLDMLKTRKREVELIETCLKLKIPLVIDNTNVTIEERSQYITMAKAFKYKVNGIFLKKSVSECVKANARREGKQRVKDVAIFSKKKQLQIPQKEEGFDDLQEIE